LQNPYIQIILSYSSLFTICSCPTNFSGEFSHITWCQKNTPLTIYFVISFWIDIIRTITVSRTPKPQESIFNKKKLKDCFGAQTASMREERRTLQGKQHTSRLDVAFIMIKQSCQKQNTKQQELENESKESNRTAPCNNTNKQNYELHSTCVLQEQDDAIVQEEAEQSTQSKYALKHLNITRTQSLNSFFLCSLLIFRPIKLVKHRSRSWECHISNHALLVVEPWGFWTDTNH